MGTGGANYIKDLIQDAVMAPMHALEAFSVRTGASPRLYRELSRFYHLTRGMMDFGEDLFRAHVRPGNVLIDIGCGPGVLAGMLSDRFRTAVGLDMDSRMIRRARRMHAEARFCRGDMLRLPFRGESASAVVSLGAIHCVAYPPLAEEVHRVLAPGGEVHVLIEDAVMPLILPRSSFRCFSDAFRERGFEPVREVKVGRLYRYLTCRKPGTG